MQKIIFGIFAHPDDEAFGPSGALLMETRAGVELHLITLTLGEAGTNPDNHPDLGEIREKEWREAGRLMGATSMHALGYKDGRLSNVSLVEAGQRIVELAQDILTEAPADAEIEFMTIDLNGISGHIDHIVAARAASWAFYTLKAKDERLTRIRYACVPEAQLPEVNTAWLFMEPGRRAEEINEIIDARALRDEIVAIMCAHHSQRGDADMHIKNRGDQLGMNYFIVKE